MANQEASKTARDYQELVKTKRPGKPVLKNLIYAFLVGGAISVVGQGIQCGFMQYGMSAKEATSPTTVAIKKRPPSLVIKIQG